MPPVRATEAAVVRDRTEALIHPRREVMCPECGCVLVHMGRIGPPHFESIVTCLPCERSWVVESESVEALSVPFVTPK
jgi:hypothetical protein